MPVPPVASPTPPAPSTGPDTDGIPDALENTIPGLVSSTPGVAAVAGDGNGDGIKDSQQSQVTSVPFLHTTTAQSNPGTAPPVFVTLVAASKEGKVDATDSHSAGASLSNVKQLDAPVDRPAESSMPLGLISFSATVGVSDVVDASTGLPTGVAETFSLYVDPTLGVNGYWKENTSGTWVNLASQAYGGGLVTEGGQTRLDFKLTDGGEFDSDHTINGTIVDPGAAGSMPLSLVGYAPELAAGTHFWF